MPPGHCLARLPAVWRRPVPTTCQEATITTTVSSRLAAGAGGEEPALVVGVDTHADVHVAACVDQLGRLLGTISIPTTPAGYDQLLTWAACFGRIQRVGVEGTGSYGAGLSRHLRAHGIQVLEVNRPDRSMRRARGKSDPIDAEAAARTVLAGRAQGTAKARDGRVEAIRALRVAKRSAMRARTQAANQLHALVKAAPAELREQLRRLPTGRLVDQLAAQQLPATPTDPSAATLVALHELARRHQALSAQLARLDDALAPLVAQTAPRLLAIHGIGTDVAGILLVTGGDDPTRLHNEGAFAHLCGAAPLPASSGRTVRHRLNRGGDRQANHALWRVVMVRMSTDPRTKAYVARRTAEGRSKREIVRCLKRYVAREVYRALIADLAHTADDPTATPASDATLPARPGVHSSAP
jgi:transposase